MLANPFESSDNRIPATFSAAPAGVTVYKWDEVTQAFRGNVKNDFGGTITWDDPLMTLYPGEGVLINTPSSFTLQVWGRIRQNCLNKSISSQYAIHSSISAVFGTVDGGMTFPVADGDTITRMISGMYQNYQYSSGVWTPSQPSVALGEAFWSLKGKGATWRQNYSAW